VKWIVGNKGFSEVWIRGFRFKESWFLDKDDSRIIGRKNRSVGAVDGRVSIWK